jgi:hypothetical protein
MCAIINDRSAKNCSGECLQLCKRGRQIEPQLLNLQKLLDNTTSSNNLMVPVVPNYDIVNKSFNEKEGYHI